MRVSIPDTLGETLQAQLHGRRTLDEEVTVRLQDTTHAPNNRVVLSQQDLNFIADRLGTGLPITTKIELTRAIDQTAQIHIGNSRLQFTPNQLLLIQHRADRLGESVDRFIARIAAKLLEDIFLVQPASEGVFAALPPPPSRVLPGAAVVGEPADPVPVGVLDAASEPVLVGSAGRPRTTVFSKFQK